MAVEWRHHALRHVVRALPATAYEVRLVTQPRAGACGKCIRTLRLTQNELSAHHAHFGRWSAQGLHVFFRPIGGPTHVLLDLDMPDTLDEVLHLAAHDGLHPSLIVETSPGRHQLWFTQPGRDHDVSVHRAACKLLAERYGGDPGSAKPTQLGRLPGTMNPKPSRATSDGTPPLVLIKRAVFRPSARLLVEAQARAEMDAARSTDTHVKRDGALPDHGLPDDELRALFDEVVEKHGGDRSAADFDIARLSRSSGNPPERAVELLMAGSPKAAEREARKKGAGRAYSERMVRLAWQVG